MTKRLLTKLESTSLEGPHDRQLNPSVATTDQRHQSLLSDVPLLCHGMRQTLMCHVSQSPGGAVMIGTDR